MPPLLRGVVPGQVRILAVDGHAEDLGAARLEVGDAVGEAGDLRRADEGEVQRVEEQHDPLALVLVHRNFLDRTLHDGLRLELRRGLSNERRHEILRFFKSTVKKANHPTTPPRARSFPSG
jgi:hypothetical protein